MTDDKIREAEYFLSRIVPNGSPEMQHNVSAFLCATRSISDHLLEEYNVKLGLNIPLSTKLDHRVFECAALAQTPPNRNAALNFLAAFELETCNVRADPVGFFLNNKRNTRTHRTSKGSMTAKVGLREPTVHADDNIGVKASYADGTVFHDEPGTPNPPPKAEETKSESGYYFSDYMADDMVTVCTKYLALMKAFVNNIRQAFP